MRGKIRVIACIEDPKVIETILAHIAERDKDSDAQPRAPPDLGFLNVNSETLELF